MRVFVFTSDKQIWALKGFAHQFVKFWGRRQPVVVVGFTPPAFPLPSNFLFVSIGPFAKYPYECWSDAVIDCLAAVNDEIICWDMEDFWLLRPVDVEAVSMLERYMIHNTTVSRMDLSSDRANNPGIPYAGSVGRLDLVESRPGVDPYHFSFQMGLWRRQDLLNCLKHGENPHQAEIEGSRRMIEQRYRALGTRQQPCRYLIAVQQGRIAYDGGYMGSEYALPGPERKELEKLGYLHE